MKIYPAPKRLDQLVMHDTVHQYLKDKIAGKEIKVQVLLADYNRCWVNEGFLSREHEEMKRKSGEKALSRFFLEEESTGILLKIY